jgi:hypothetical protein
VGKGEGVSKINVKTMIAAHKGIIKKNRLKKASPKNTLAPKGIVRNSVNTE